MANINNTASNTLLSGTSDNDSIQNGGRHNGGSYVSIAAGAGNDSIYNYNSTGNADIAFDSAY